MCDRTYKKHLLLGVGLLTLAVMLAVPFIASAQVAPPIVRLKTDLSVVSGEDPTTPGLVLDAGAVWRAGIVFKVGASPLDAIRFPDGCKATITVTRGAEVLLSRATDLALCGKDTALDFVQKPTALMLEVGDHVDVMMSCTDADGVTHTSELAGDL